MKFCTAINCIDGRVQLPVIEYLKERFSADYVDCVTEAGEDLIMSEHEPARVEATLRCVQISLERHDSKQIAIAGHHGCAGNPVSKDKHIEQIKEAVRFLKTQFPKIEIIGLWVDENWEVAEVA